MLECLGGSLASGAGGGGIAVPRGVGAEVAFPRSHLVEAARGKLIKAHEWVGPKRGEVWVPGLVWRGLVPFFHEEVLALLFELGVRAAPGGLWVVVDEQVLGGDREGAEPVRAQEKHHGVREGVEGEVGSVLRGGSGLDPREGKAAARMACAQDPVVW